MPKPLTQTQIATLAIEAHRAFCACDPGELDALREALAQGAEADGDPFACAATVKKTALFEAWRRAETARALEGIGRKPADSFKALTQNDFAFVKAHFVSFYDSAKSKALFERARDEDRRRLLWVIRKNCEASANMAYPEYPESICRTQYKCGLDEASPSQLRRILYTTRNRKK